MKLNFPKRKLLSRVALNSIRFETWITLLSTQKIKTFSNSSSCKHSIKLLLKKKNKIMLKIKRKKMSNSWVQGLGGILRPFIFAF